MLTLAVARPVFCSERKKTCWPRRTKIQSKHLKLAIQHAENICWGVNADTPSCRVAWDRVEELSAEMARQREEEKFIEHLIKQEDLMCEIDPRACKEYDL